MNSIPDLIRRLLDAGLSQAEIARRTGIHQSRLSRWERKAAKGADDALKLAALAEEVNAPGAPAVPAEQEG